MKTMSPEVRQAYDVLNAECRLYGVASGSVEIVESQVVHNDPYHFIPVRRAVNSDRQVVLSEKAFREILIKAETRLEGLAPEIILVEAEE